MTQATVFERMDECTLAELNDGRVYLNMRNEHSLKFKNSTSCECRGVATSEDGGATFGKLRMDPALPSPICQATLSSAGGSLLFANPASKQSRTQGEIKKSTDMGETWSSTLHVTHPGATIDQASAVNNNPHHVLTTLIFNVFCVFVFCSQTRAVNGVEGWKNPAFPWGHSWHISERVHVFQEVGSWNPTMNLRRFTLEAVENVSGSYMLRFRCFYDVFGVLTGR